MEDITQDEKEASTEPHSIREVDGRESVNDIKNVPKEYGDALAEKYCYQDNTAYSILDEYSKVIFPISFIIFLICYAVVCTSIQ